ncbi:MAG: GNAT family N-acetyltransferase, partial [Muribaculaceae bacterium]|nr:GNAT family N-acetyltransferase [Muribaculaceae bacterium]
MAVTIKKLAPEKSAINEYVKFGIDLYKGNDCYVPPLIFDEVATLHPEKNPAFEVCSAQMFMAYRDGKPVGRITAIINDLVNKKEGKNTLRFGFVDFIDDQEVVDALFEAAEKWGREHGCTTMVGPMGFSDMDHEGMLIEGFDE